MTDKKIKIAVIEDDPSIRDIYDFKLKKDGFTVKSANDGIEGLELIKSFRPDIILLDILMPNQNGDEMLKELREYPWAKGIRVIILTNISKDEAPSKLKFLKVDRYIVKAHYTPSQVVEVVKEVLAG